MSFSSRGIPWATQITIPKGKNIVLNGINTKMQVGLDASGTTRLLRRRRRLAVCDKRRAFKNGKGHYGGAIDSKGTIARLDNVVFEGNIATQDGGAVYLERRAVASET